MDKFEYNSKVEQIKKMYEKKDFLTVAEIANNIDIRKVKDSSLINIMTDAYEASGQLDKAKEVLIYAYERSPLGRQLAYRLTILCVKLGQIDEAFEFYDDFIKLAPKDIGQYILKYEIGKSRGDSLDEQIKILETYVSQELDEKWQYELAKLYHETGQSNKCVEQCDEIILWFSEGKYVNKAMELKLLYVPLTKLQQYKYDNLWKSQELFINTQDIIRNNAEKNKPEIDFEMEIDMDVLEVAAITDERDSYEQLPLEEIAQEEFKNALFEEEIDGQIGLYIDPSKTVEEQIQGQMTIGDILDDYEERQKLINVMIKEESLSHEVCSIIAEETEEEIAATDETEDDITDEIVLDNETEEHLLSDEYKEIFERYLSIEDAEKQLANSLDNLINNFDKDGTSKKNNIIIIGDSKSGRTSLVIDLIKVVNKKRGRRGRKVAKVRGGQLNQKGLEETIPKLLGADLIIEEAANMNSTTTEELVTALRNYTDDMIVVLEDNKSAIERLLSVNTILPEMFENIINIQGLGVKEWAEVAKEYASNKGYMIDEMGILALHVKIGNLYSTSDHINVESIYKIIDYAIEKNQKTRQFKLFKKKKNLPLTLKEMDFI